VPRPDPSTVSIRTIDGRIPGRRARQTRSRYLDCLRELLASTRYRDITVTDLARKAGGVPGTFYQYFPDLDAAILALAEETAESGAQLRKLIQDGPATAADEYRAIGRLVDAFLEFWRENEPVLRVIDSFALEDDQRFRKIRVRMLNSVTRALADLSAHSGQPAGVDPMAMAGTLVGLLAHVSAHQGGFPVWGIALADVRESVLRLVYWGISGQAPPVS
jgi:AcrR family transcriptional regulator